MGFVPDEFEMQAEQAGAGDIVLVKWKKTALTAKCLKQVGAGTWTWLGSGGIATWAPAGTDVDPSRWAASTAYVVGQVVHPVALTSTGVAAGTQTFPLFKCTTAGTSNSTEPTWNPVVGATVTDSGVTWTCIDTKTQFAAEWGFLTGITAVLPDGTTATPAPTGLGLTVPAALQTASAVYDWYARGRNRL
jgi:hypothetical protein